MVRYPQNLRTVRVQSRNNRRFAVHQIAQLHIIRYEQRGNRRVLFWWKQIERIPECIGFPASNHQQNHSSKGLHVLPQHHHNFVGTQTTNNLSRESVHQFTVFIHHHMRCMRRLQQFGIVRRLFKEMMNGVHSIKWRPSVLSTTRFRTRFQSAWDPVQSVQLEPVHNHQSDMVFDETLKTKKLEKSWNFRKIREMLVKNRDVSTCWGMQACSYSNKLTKR